MKAKYINALICPTNSYQTYSMCSPVLSAEQKIMNKSYLQGQTD